MFFNAYVLQSLKLFRLKNEGQTILTENLADEMYKMYKTETKILANLGSALHRGSLLSELYGLALIS